MRLSRLPLAVLLAFLLLFAQQAAAVHGLSHYADSQQPDKHYPGDKVCEKCAAFAELSGAVACADIVFHTAEFTQHLPRVVLEGLAHAAFVPYLSRAPPPLS